MSRIGDDDKTLVNQYVLDSYNGVTDKLNARADELGTLAADVRRSLLDTQALVALFREEVRHARELSESLRDKVSLLRTRMKWVLATCTLLVFAEGYSVVWRTKGRELQYEIRDYAKACASCAR